MKRITIAAVLFLYAHPLAQSDQQAPSEDARLASHFKKFLDEELRHQPLEATRLGDHRFDHLLDDLSGDARAARLDRIKQALAALPRDIDQQRLSRDSSVDFNIFRDDLQRELWLALNTRPHADDPRIYNDYITESVYLLLTQSTLPLQDNLRNAAARMKQIPRIIAAARANLKNPPRVILETAISQNRGAISFYEKDLFDLAGETPALGTLREEARKVAAALRDHHKFLEELLPNAKGEWRLGKEKFARKLELELNAGITAKEVLKEAEAEAERVVAEMYVIARQLWHQVYPGEPLPADEARGKQATIRKVLDKVSQEHGTVDELVRDARAGADKIEDFIRTKDILRLPDPDRCKIIEMPEFQRGNSLAYLNPAPPLDAKAASYYAVSPPPRGWAPKRVASLLQEYNRHMLQILTIHEAYPGHYVQLEYANRHPSLIRRVLFSGVFAEGWAVYTEQMMLDQGYGNGDLKLRLNQLKFYLRAVVNAILDHRMHCGTMTDEEALALLVTFAFQSEAEAILKIIRAKQSSCQLSTYFVGRMAFVRLRRRIQNELGAGFNLGRYHEAVLAHGTLPVRYLPDLVTERLKRSR
ncbi:MAG: DUF885 domain-containing protein [Planctomycetes bacterium]|nr:DUF885 domain-containing protein [Planctomycetota bacterium]